MGDNKEYKKVLKKLKKISKKVNRIDNNVYGNKKTETLITRDHQVYDEVLENVVLEYIDMLLESNNVSEDIRIDYDMHNISIRGEGSISVPNSKYSSSMTKARDYYFTININTCREENDRLNEFYIECGNIGYLSSTYKKITEDHINKLQDLSRSLKREKILKGFNDVYNISGLARERSLKQMDI